MNADDTFTELFPGPSRARRLWRWFATAPRGERALSERDVLLELSSVDMTVRFFEDRFEYHRRLGAKRGSVPYRAIRVARLVRGSSLLVRRPMPRTFDATPDAKTLTVTTSSRAKPLTFDFRSEPSAKIREALTLIDRGLAR